MFPITDESDLEDVSDESDLEDVGAVSKLEYVALHPDFKSIIHGTFVSGKDLSKYFGSYHSGEYSDVNVPSFEKKNPNYKQLKTFTVDFNMIDRFYYHGPFCNDGLDGEEMFFRSCRSYGPVYVHMRVYCIEDCGSDIFVTQDADTFLRGIVQWYCDPHKIRESMLEDGLTVKKPSWHEYQKEEDLIEKLLPLEIICLMKIGCLDVDYEKILPVTLSKVVNDFFKIRDVRDEHFEEMEVVGFRMI